MKDYEQERSNRRWQRREEFSLDQGRIGLRVLLYKNNADIPN
jgi:hypothetical protein